MGKGYKKVEGAMVTMRSLHTIMPTQSKWIVRSAGLCGALAVGMGAYGAHVLREKHDVPEELKRVFETGNRYHLLHSVALLCAPLCRKPTLVSGLLITGMFLFCGSCYHYSLTGQPTFRKVTPYGGVLLICGWLAMIL